MSIPTILAIEDNFGDIAVLRLSLDQLGIEYRLEILSDGQAALEHVADRRSGRREPVPCVILLDLHLPKYNGVDVLNAIRQDPVLTNVHVIVFTSFASPEEQADVAAMGALLRKKPSDLRGFSDLAENIVEICKDSTIFEAEAPIA